MINDRVPCSAIRFTPNEKHKHIADVWVNGTPSTWAIAQCTRGVVWKNVLVTPFTFHLFRDDPQWSVLCYNDQKGWTPCGTGDWDACIYLVRGLIATQMRGLPGDEEKGAMW